MIGTKSWHSKLTPPPPPPASHPWYNLFYDKRLKLQTFGFKRQLRAMGHTDIEKDIATTRLYRPWCWFSKNHSHTAFKRTLMTLLTVLILTNSWFPNIQPLIFKILHTWLRETLHWLSQHVRIIASLKVTQLQSRRIINFMIIFKTRANTAQTESCLKVARKLTEICQKVARKLPKSCQKVCICTKDTSIVPKNYT